MEAVHLNDKPQEYVVSCYPQLIPLLERLSACADLFKPGCADGFNMAKLGTLTVGDLRQAKEMLNALR